MRPRVFVARFLIRLGLFIEGLSIMIMKPADLIHFSRQKYAKLKSIRGWDRQDIVDAGLNPLEQELTESIPIKKGSILLLGIGTGREAIPLAQMGFDVTGVDYIPEMVQLAVDNARQRDLSIKGLVQDISLIDVPDRTYDVIWLSSTMYSCIPTRAKRVLMMKRLRAALKNNGLILCQFQWSAQPSLTQKVKITRKLFSWFTLGNLTYEEGDILWGNVEFIHCFSSEKDLVSEFEHANLLVDQLLLPPGRIARGGAILKKCHDVF